MVSEEHQSGQQHTDLLLQAGKSRIGRVRVRVSIRCGSHVLTERELIISRWIDDTANSSDSPQSHASSPSSPPRSTQLSG